MLVIVDVFETDETLLTVVDACVSESIEENDSDEEVVDSDVLSDAVIPIVFSAWEVVPSSEIVLSSICVVDVWFVSKG